MFTGIDLSSDTATKPTQAMKAAMMDAPLGDEQKDEDPTTRALERQVAELLGMGDAVFFPSATMSNQVAILLLTEPGSEMLAAEGAHIFVAESGASAVLARVMSKSIRTPDGLYTSEQVRALAEPSGSAYRPKPALISLENTTFAGGLVWSKQALSDIVTAADTFKLRKHLDGARLCNASVASGLSLANLATGFDTTTICLSKGLGCPIGAVLGLRDASLRPLARHYKHMLGGAMRQSGIVAAAGIYALKHHVKRLSDDHQHAQTLAEGLGLFNTKVQCANPQPQSNIVLFDWVDNTLSADTFYQTCLDKNIRFSRITPTRFRAITHLDVTHTDIQRVLQVLTEVLG